MPHANVLGDLVILAGFALVITLVFQRLRLPAVTGFILAGVLIGPGGFRLIADVDAVRTLAELGVVLLLFTLGLEFSPADLRGLGRTSGRPALLHMVLIALLVAASLGIAGIHPARAIFFGLLVSLSSTALLLKLFTDRGELQSPHARLAIGVLLFQDLALVPLTLATPLLGKWAGGQSASPPSLADAMRALFLIAAIVLVAVLAGRVVPWLLRKAWNTRSREAFLAGVVVVALGSAYLSQAAGLSLALGAFLAGLFLASSELRSQVLADVMPIRDALSSVFFISIGMLLVPDVVVRSPGIVVAATVGVVLVKALAGIIAIRIAGERWNVAIGTGVALAQVGEFAFVLAGTGAAAGLLPPPWDQAFLVSALFSIVVAPWLVAAAPEWGLRGDLVLRAWLRRPGEPVEPEPVAISPLRADHVVIGGYGLNGRNIARVLRAVRITHVVIDQSPELVATCQLEGSPAILGNLAQPEILHQAGVGRARCLVLALSDPSATGHAARLARQMNRHLFTIVRTRYVRELDNFYAAGANLVIPEEFETSIEIFIAVLRQFHVPHNIVQAQVDLLRRERYSLLRGMKLPGSVVEQLDAIMAEGTTETVLILQQSPAVGRTLEELGLTEAHPSCRAVAVVRGGHAMTEFDDGFKLQVGDTLVLVGPHAHIDAAMERLSPQAPSGV